MPKKILQSEIWARYGVIRRQAFQAIRPSFKVIFRSFKTFPEETKDLEETNSMKKKISRYLRQFIFLVLSEVHRVSLPT